MSERIETKWMFSTHSVPLCIYFVYFLKLYVSWYVALWRIFMYSVFLSVLLSYLMNKRVHINTLPFLSFICDILETFFITLRVWGISYITDLFVIACRNREICPKGCSLNIYAAVNHWLWQLHKSKYTGKSKYQYNSKFINVNESEVLGSSLEAVEGRSEESNFEMSLERIYGLGWENRRRKSVADGCCCYAQRMWTKSKICTKYM